MNKVHKSFKESIENHLCEQGFICTFLGKEFVHFVKVDADEHTGHYSEIVIQIFNSNSSSGNTPYENYSYRAYETVDNNLTKNPVSISKNTSEQINKIAEELSNHNWDDENYSKKTVKFGELNPGDLFFATNNLENEKSNDIYLKVNETPAVCPYNNGMYILNAINLTRNMITSVVDDDKEVIFCDPINLAIKQFEEIDDHRISEYLKNNPTNKDKLVDIVHTISMGLIL